MIGWNNYIEFLTANVETVTIKKQDRIGYASIEEQWLNCHFFGHEEFHSIVMSGHQLMRDSLVILPEVLSN